MTPSIVFLDRDTLPTRIRLRPPHFAHEWRDYPATSPEQVVERLQGAQIAIVNKVRLGEAELSQLPDLRLIAEAATGCDNLDLAACQRHGVAVCNVQGYAIHAVAEHALALMLARWRTRQRCRWIPVPLPRCKVLLELSQTIYRVNRKQPMQCKL